MSYDTCVIEHILHCSIVTAHTHTHSGSGRLAAGMGYCNKELRHNDYRKCSFSLRRRSYCWRSIASHNSVDQSSSQTDAVNPRPIQSLLYTIFSGRCAFIHIHELRERRH